MTKVSMMIERVLEPEVMDSPEEATEYDEMDHSHVNRLFVDDYLDAAPNDLRDILDLGTGTARIPIEMCRRSDDIRIMAVDMSPSMLDVARLNIEIAEFTDRIRLELADSKELPFEQDFFDCVVSNSIIHHIPDPSVALKEAVRVARPTGFLFFRDLSRPESLEAVEKLVETYAADETDAARQMFYNSLCAALSIDEVRKLVNDLGFPSGSVTASSDRHWTWAAQKPA